MTDPEQALAAQLRNIETRTGRELASLCEEIARSGLAKHGEIRAHVIETFGLGYGDANSLTHYALKTKGAPKPIAEDGDALVEIYSPKKAHLRPIHDALVEAMSGWGDYEIAPKKAYVAFRRKKQFAMLGPKTNDRAELGINLKDDIESAAIVRQKPGGMCQYAVALTTADDLSAEVLAALRRAFDAAA